jgi:hypothetical protein
VPNIPLGWALAAVSALILSFGIYIAAEPVREFFRQGFCPERWSLDLRRRIRGRGLSTKNPA